MKLYGLIGYPLGHSFSKQYFTEKFAKERLTDCVFEAFPIPSVDELPALLKSNPGLEALCVTIPYKEQVLKYIDVLSEEVKEIGAANSIKIENGKLTAYNTDIAGFKISFEEQLQPHHKKALILGTGGAAKAVQYVLRQMNMAYLVVTRNTNDQPGHISYDAVDAAMIKEYPVIINCTPVGMWPKENEAPQLPYHLLSAANYLYDLVYKPAKTKFLQLGEERGAVIKNGYDMLIIQAEESWRIWNLH